MKNCNRAIKVLMCHTQGERLQQQTCKIREENKEGVQGYENGRNKQFWNSKKQ